MTLETGASLQRRYYVVKSFNLKIQREQQVKVTRSQYLLEEYFEDNYYERFDTTVLPGLT